MSQPQDTRENTRPVPERDGLTRGVRRFRLLGREGPFGGRVWTSVGDRTSIGAHASNDLVIQDHTVSRFHAEVHVTDTGLRVTDMGSHNGTVIDGVPVVSAWLRDGSLIRMGRTLLEVKLTSESTRLDLSREAHFGRLVGTSVAMRHAFALLGRAARSDATVLLQGETGTGKDLAAVAIHEEGARRDGPFVVIDCGAVSPHLLESEFFGHERGAFTGAVRRRRGAFEEAGGGTIFLDEVAELPIDLQPKLLRVLEQREIQPVGSSEARPVDVRVVAATNRDLRSLVNAGNFRLDLYYRLAVITIRLPPLRERPEDLPLLVRAILDSLTADAADAAPLLTGEFLSALGRCAWPGNGRQLRNHLERCLVFAEATPPDVDERVGASIDVSIPYAEARRRALLDFERRYLASLMEICSGNVSRAARTARMDRGYLYRVLRRIGYRP